jgi:hypothetical protein
MNPNVTPINNIRASPSPAGVFCQQSGWGCRRFVDAISWLGTQAWVPGFERQEINTIQARSPKKVIVNYRQLSLLLPGWLFNGLSTGVKFSTVSQNN